MGLCGSQCLLGSPGEFIYLHINEQHAWRLTLLTQWITTLEGLMHCNYIS
jgi:hypothetical protein